MEFENIKDALQFAIEVTESDPITVDGNPATIKDVQELIREPLCSIADLLGLSELYLEK